MLLHAPILSKIKLEVRGSDSFGCVHPCSHTREGQAGCEKVGFFGSMVMVIVVALSSHARIWGKCLINPSVRVLFLFLSGDQLVHTSSTLQSQDQSRVAQ